MQAICEKLRLDRNKLTHWVKWSTEFDYKTVLFQAAEDCEALLSFDGDRASQLVYIKHAQDMAAYLMISLSWTIGKLGLLERFYRICPVPTMLSDSISVLFGGPDREREEHSVVSAHTALALGGVPSVDWMEQLGGNTLDSKGLEYLPSPEQCQLLLENMALADGYFFHDEFSYSRVGMVMNRLLGKVMEEGDGAWAIGYLERHKEMLHKLFCSMSNLSQRADEDLRVVYEQFQMLLNGAYSEKPLVALYENKPDLYHKLVQSPQIKQFVFYHVASCTEFDLRQLPANSVLNKQETQQACLNALFSQNDRLSFKVIENLEGAYVHAGGEIKTFRSAIVRSADFRNQKQAALAVFEGVADNDCLDATLKARWTLSRDQREAQESLLPAVIAVLNYDKKSTERLKDLAFINRLSAFFLACEGVDILPLLDLERKGLSLQELRGVKHRIVENNGSVGEVMKHYLKPLLELTSTQRALAHLSFDEFKYLTRCASHVFTPELMRSISWHDISISEEMLSTDLGM
jgi:hypothetical protein